MKQAVPLNINIPKPCSQNWDGMASAGEGKYCANCNNIVHDFSQMSDGELANFFKNSMHKPCGRFYIAQLERNIQPQNIQIPYFKKLHKIAATFLTVVSLKAMPAAAEKKHIHSFENPEEKKKNNSVPPTDSIIISGKVEDEDGHGFAGVSISAREILYALTDGNGVYSFKIKQEDVWSGNLYFGFPGYSTIVRSYHAAMGNTAFNIQMKKYTDSNSSFLMGVPVFPALEDLPALEFKPGAYTLSAANKAKLATIAAKMKAMPFAAISLHINAGAEKKQDVYAFRAKNIKKYLIEKEGISDTRISTEFEMDGDKNKVDIRSIY